MGAMGSAATLNPCTEQEARRREFNPWALVAFPTSTTLRPKRPSLASLRALAAIDLAGGVLGAVLVTPLIAVLLHELGGFLILLHLGLDLQVAIVAERRNID